MLSACVNTTLENGVKSEFNRVGMDYVYLCTNT